MPKVDLWSSFNLSPTVLARIARVCTTPLERSMNSLISQRDKDIALCKSLYTKGHWSVFEHASMTYLVECSRACSLQLARHRHISRTEMSQRYVKIDLTTDCLNDVFEFPESNNSWFGKACNDALIAYKKLLDDGVKPEDARFILPEATKTRMFLTLNLRTLLELTQKRAVNEHAQWEIRELVKLMWEQIPLDIKDIFRPELTWLDNETTDSVN